MLKEDKQIGTGMVNHKKLKAEIYQKISDIIDGNNIKDNSSRDDSDYLVDRFGKRSVPNIIDIYIVSEVYDIKMHGILMTEEGEKFKRLIQTQKKEICENLAKWFTEQSKQS